MKDRVLFGVRLTPAVNGRITLEASRRGQSKNALIAQVLWEWIAAQDAKNAKSAQKVRDANSA